MSSSVSDRLQAGKKRAAEERSQIAEQERLEEEAREQAAYERDERERERMAVERALQQRNAQLLSYVSGIYEELQKLYVKRPTDPVSQVTLEHVNRGIRDVRHLIADEHDEYFDELKELVTAGSLPEIRDVVLRLRIVKDALVRLQGRHAKDWNRTNAPVNSLHSFSYRS